jgi:hypothetical protein
MRIMLSLADLGTALTRIRKSTTLTSWMRRPTMRICVAKWVEKLRDKPIPSSFLKPNRGHREEMRYTFDMSKCDHLFDLQLQGGVI